MAQYLLKNAAILTMDADFTLYEDGYLAVEGNSIQEIGPTAQLEESRFAGYTVLDCRGTVSYTHLIHARGGENLGVYKDDVGHSEK